MLICRTLAELSPACLQELSLPEWSCTNALIVNVEGGMFLCIDLPAMHLNSHKSLHTCTCVYSSSCLKLYIPLER